MNKGSVLLIFIMSCMEVADSSMKNFWVPKLSEENATEKEEKSFEKRKLHRIHFSVGLL